MSKQKICVFGGGVSGLLTAITLSQYNVKIDLVTGNLNKSINNRTLALSHSNYDFLNQLINLNTVQKIAWPISKMKLFNVNKKNTFPSEVFQIYNKDTEKKVLFMLENKKFFFLMKKAIKKIKKIKIKKIASTDLLKLKGYNLIINCTGPYSQLTKKIPFKKDYQSYKEIAATFTITHENIKNNIARQIFLNEGPMAFLPISDTKTSIVWSIKDIYLSKLKNKKNRDNFVKKKVQSISKIFFKVNSTSFVEYFNLNFNLSKDYFFKRILNFGDILHQIHPFAGQGFNMIIRDLLCLKDILDKKLKLGLDIGDKSVLIEFSKKIRSQNFLFASGVDVLNKVFSIKNSPVKNIRDFSIKKINKNIFIKKIILDLADKGIHF